MLALIFIILFGGAVAYFATLNTDTLTLHFLSYKFSDIPIYLVMLGFLLVGLLAAWIVHLLNAISSSRTLNAKEQALQEEKRMNLELTKRVHQLELENTKLTAKENDTDIIENSL